MKTEHTPGPWKAVEMGVVADVLTSHGNFYVCSLINAENPEDKANARLIAAAPEMLEALKFLLDRFQNFAPWENKLERLAEQKAKDAIAKAEGL